MRFVPLIENNEHEGETWYHWLQIDGNWDELVELKSILWAYDEMESYLLDLDCMESEEVVDKLCLYSVGTYMSTHNKVTGRLFLPEGFEADDCYKGRIEEYFKE